MEKQGIGSRWDGEDGGGSRDGKTGEGLERWEKGMLKGWDDRIAWERGTGWEW